MKKQTPKYNFATNTNMKLTKLKHLKHHFCLHHLLVTSQGVRYIHYWNMSDIQGCNMYFMLWYVCIYITYEREICINILFSTFLRVNPWWAVSLCTLSYISRSFQTSIINFIALRCTKQHHYILLCIDNLGQISDMLK